MTNTDWQAVEMGVHGTWKAELNGIQGHQRLNAATIIPTIPSAASDENTMLIASVIPVPVLGPHSFLRGPAWDHPF